MTATPFPYGSWPSVIHSEQLTSNTVRLNEPQLDQGHCYWLEQRPEEKGRCVVVCQKMANGGSDKDGEPFDITPPDMSVRTKAHEYGGGSYLVHNGVCYFVNASDQRVYKIHVETGSSPITLSPENSDHTRYCYWCFEIDEHRQQLIGICEIHRKPKEDQTQLEPESNIISLKLDGSSTIGFNVLVFGNDFYSNPRISPDGEKLSWLTWNHPNMFWDNSECWIADFTNLGMLNKHRKVAGGMRSQTSENTHDSLNEDHGESVFQPEWSPTGDLIFVSDRSNWWNLYSYNTYNKYTETLLEMPAEFATPQWVFGMSTYGFLNSYTLFCTYTQNGIWHIGLLDLMSHTFIQQTSAQQTSTQQTLDFTYYEGIACQDDNDSALFIAANENTLPQLIHWTTSRCTMIKESSASSIDHEHISIPENITFKNDQQEDVHGFFYPPHNTQYCGKQDTLPPLIVMSHGGPTGATNSALNLKIQYWTNRGFAVFDINYSGSTGYGRQYRRRLYQQWGIKDVEDLCLGAEYLINEKKVNPNQVAIRGSSAGGYSVLAALTFKDTFKAGASLYGIGDLCLLAEDTHKFESRYCDQLIGEYPKEKSLYQQRSPINYIDQLNCPVIFLQGLDDNVVPPNQAELMVNALHQKNIPVAYVTFEGEGQGFRQAKNIRYAIDVEYAFYTKIFTIEVSEDILDVPFVTLEEKAP